jgi:hypothetical protein
MASTLAPSNASGLAARCIETTAPAEGASAGAATEPGQEEALISLLNDHPLHRNRSVAALAAAVKQQWQQQ